MTGNLLLAAFCIGSAAIGLWLVVRYPRPGPTRPLTIIFVVLAATLALEPAAAMFGLIAGHGGVAPALGLLLVLFPALTAAFWAAACGFRALADLRPRL